LAHPFSLLGLIAAATISTASQTACQPPSIPLQPATGYTVDYSVAQASRSWQLAPPAGQPDLAPVLRLHADGMFALSGVPWFHQGQDQTCAQANVATLLNYWGIQHSYPAVVKEMNPANLPTDAGNSSVYLRKKGLQSRDYRLATLNCIRQQVARGRPTLVLLDFRSLANTHWVTVKGHDRAGKKLLINDPVAGPNVVMDVDTFQRRWRNDSPARMPGVGDRYRNVAFDIVKP
jgi:predicted double-glycine peptidase